MVTERENNIERKQSDSNAEFASWTGSVEVVNWLSKLYCNKWMDN